MAQISYRANLSSAIFPMTLARAGRSVIIPGPDQNFDRRVDPAGEQKDAGIPQVIYMENVLPTANGYQSVAFDLMEAGTLPYADMAIFELKIPGAAYPEILAIRSGGVGSQAYRLYLDTWVPISFVGTSGVMTSEDEFSYAVVKGVVYVYYDKYLYTYAIAGGFTGTLTNITATVTPAGIMNNVRGIAGAYNYLILLDSAAVATIYWSSTISAIDFAPSLITGAGSTGVSNVQGQARFMRASPSGFFIYTDNNVISVKYTGNARYPWRFTPIQDTIGVQHPWEVYSDTDESYQYAINRVSGVRRVNENISDAVAPEISEYLERSFSFDDFNYTLDTFEVRPRTSSTEDTYRIYLYASRYIFISYRERTVSGLPGLYDTAFVYDLQLNRYGKIRRRHSHIITCQRSFTGKFVVGLVDNFARTLTNVILDITLADQFESKGVILLGKFQYVRSRDLCLDELSIESGQVVDSTVGPQPYPGNFHVRTFPTSNGKDFLPAQTPYYRTDDSSAVVGNYFCRTEGRNVSVLIKGAFDLCSVELTFHVGGNL